LAGVRRIEVTDGEHLQLLPISDDTR
jgi:hypothetical protein